MRLPKYDPTDEKALKHLATVKEYVDGYLKARGINIKDIFMLKQPHDLYSYSNSMITVHYMHEKRKRKATARISITNTQKARCAIYYLCSQNNKIEVYCPKLFSSVAHNHEQRFHYEQMQVEEYKDKVRSIICRSEDSQK